MEVTVRDGKAEVTNNAGHAMQLGLAERAIVDSSDEGHIVGPLSAARNIVANGDFQSALPSGWNSYREQSDPQQPSGNIGTITNEGRRVVDFYRDGSNHAELGLRQEINYDVRDFASLELHLTVNVLHQNISGFGGCGYLSSECPIIVLIDYEDVYGTDRQWRHGFYTGEPAPDWPLYPWTEKIPLGTWQPYDSGNLMQELGNSPPALIKSLTLYASGHEFHAMVTEVELLAQE
jgi:hypothetical protein